jgi:hypothetical protein
MKTWIVSIGFLSASAFSCPNLAGSYQCESDGESYALTLTQTLNEDGFHVFTYTNEDESFDLIADGKVIEVPTEDGKVAYSASCPAGKDALVLSMDIESGEYSITAAKSSTVDTSGNVNSKTKGTVVSNGQKYDFDSLETCTKN